MKPPIELDDENAAPPVNVLPRSSSLPSLSPLNTSVHVVKSTPIPVEITVEEVSIQGKHVASLLASIPTTNESQKIKTTSTNSTATPDPRWPSKCRWSMESPPPVTSTGTVSIEEKISGPEMSSKPTVVSNGIEDMRHQIDVNDLESTLKDSSETEYIMGVSDSGVEPELEVAGGSESSPSTGIPPITTISPEISIDSSIPKFVPSIGAWAKPLTFIPPATPPTPATPSGFDLQYLNNLLDSFWPTLPDGLGSNQKKKDHPSLTREFPRMPVQKIPVLELKEDGTLRFPWAAIMDPATRNLYRAARPNFDGTPQVTIHSQVLRLGPENKKEYIIGHFHCCSLPPGGFNPCCGE